MSSCNSLSKNILKASYSLFTWRFSDVTRRQHLMLSHDVAYEPGTRYRDRVEPGLIFSNSSN